MNIQQAYINGFIKRAAEHGINQNDAVEILKNVDDQDLRHYAEDYKRSARMLGLSPEEQQQWYDKHYEQGKTLDPAEFAKEMRRVYYNRGYDKLEV